MATLVKHGDTIKANGTDYAVEGIIEGRVYSVGLLYRSGTGTMQDIGFAEDADGTLNTYYETDNTTAVSITATTQRAREMRALAPALRFSIASASSLNAKLICKPIQHGY